MFGKKDKAEKAVKAEKPAKVVKEKAPAKTKSKKSKASSGKSGPNFFAAHVEKLILGVVVAATGYVIYDGISRKGYPTDRQPTSLNQSAGDALQQISVDHTEAIFAEREIKHAFVPEVEKSRRPIEWKKFSLGSLQNENSSGPVELRGDPKILPPEQLVVKCVSGAVAIEVPKETPDPFEVFEDAPRITIKKPKPPKNKEEPEEDEDKIKPPARRLMSKYDLGAPIGAMGGMMGGMEGGMGMGMGGSMGGGMGGMDGGRGGMGSGMGMGGAPGGGGGGGLGANKNLGPKTKVASQAQIFVAATALVRHKEMSEEFERQLKNSGDYNLLRDTPVYLTFEIQRVDVSQNPGREVQEKEWKTVSDGSKQVAMRKNWAIKAPLGRPVPEIIDLNARHPGLTMPIPPMLIKDYRDFAKHPAIDWVWDTKRLMAPPKRKENKKEDEGEEDVLPGQGSGGAATGGMGGMGSGMMGGMGMGGMGGMDGGMEGGFGMGDGMEGGMGMEGEYGGSYGGMEGGMEGYGGMGMGMGGSGMGGSGMGGSGMGGMTMSAGPQPEYKMLRFYDMLTPQDVGKSFRYRVRLIMRDPNYPERIKRRIKPGEYVDFEIPPPQPNTLQKEVFDRIADQRRVDDAAHKADPKTRRKMLETEWSEPSQPVRIAARVDAFAGLGYDPASNPRPSAVSGETEANLVATWMDATTGVTYAKAFDARRGSVLNSNLASKKEIIEFVVPATRVVKQREWPFASNSVVVDIRGGEELAASSKRDGDPLAASGEVMLILGDGSMQITNDIDDTFEYRMYTFADEHEMAKKAGANGGMMGGMGEGGMMGGGMGSGGMGSGGMEGGGGPAGGKGRGGK